MPNYVRLSTPRCIKFRKKDSRYIVLLKRPSAHENDCKHFWYCTLHSWISCSWNIPNIKWKRWSKNSLISCIQAWICWSRRPFFTKVCISPSYWVYWWHPKNQSNNQARIPMTIFLARCAIQSIIKLYCDTYGKFLNVEVNWPGSLHNGSNQRVGKTYVFETVTWKLPENIYNGDLFR